MCTNDIFILLWSNSINFYIFIIGANIDLLEFKLKQISENHLLAKLEDHNVFLVEPPIHNREFRLKVVELLFEKFKTGGVFMHKAPILSS